MNTKTISFKRLTYTAGSLVLSIVACFFLVCDSDPSDSDDSDSGTSTPQTSPKPTSYLGYGYDVINSSYININDVKVAYPILDLQKMRKDSLLYSQPASQQDFQEFAGLNVSSFYRDRNAGLSKGVNSPLLNDVLNVLFSGKYTTEFSLSADAIKNANAGGRSVYSYLRGRTYNYTQDEFIIGATAESLQKYLSSNFSADLKTKTPSQLLDKYGSHVLVRYYKGGSLEFNYVYDGTSLTTQSNMKLAVSESFLGISSNYSSNENSLGHELEQNSLFHFYTYGGKHMDASSIEELKKNYDDWLSSISDKSDICGIGNFDQSLISIWELAEAAGLSNANDIKEEFITRAISQGNLLLARKDITTVEQKYTKNGSYTLTISDTTVGSPAIIEVYVLGAGGGGQGGNKLKQAGGSDYNGTGGAGGGGAAAYMKLVVDQPSLPVTLNITVGKGGDAGGYISGRDESGTPGVTGGTSSVRWTSKNINLYAEGGSGGGGSGTIVSGGVGGKADESGLPHGKDVYKEGAVSAGNSGSNGNTKNDMISEGGKAALLTVGSISPFGGGNGGRRTSSGIVGPSSGSGGSGGFSESVGQIGGDGMVHILISSYVGQ